MGRPRSDNPSFAAARARAYRARKAAGIRCYWVRVDEALAREKLAHLGYIDSPQAGAYELQKAIDRFLDDALIS